MLRRSTSFDTRPMPMKMAMNRPNTAVAASPRSLMILMSCPAVSCPRTNDDPISRMANRTRLYGTRSRTDSRNTLTATQLTARIGLLARKRRAGTGPRLGDAADEKVFERLTERIQRHECGPGGDEIRQQPLRRRLEGERQGVAAGRDFDDPPDAGGDAFEHFRLQVRDDELPAVDLEGQDVGQA